MVLVPVARVVPAVAESPARHAWAEQLVACFRSEEVAVQQGEQVASFRSDRTSNVRRQGTLRRRNITRSSV
jgi:hypothetical protein